MKNFTSGLLAGAILTTSIGTYAATNGRVIEVFDNVKKVVVNKVEKPFNKNNTPFVYNGTTYVPLRFVADALGENVSWDGKTGTISIGKTYTNKSSFWGRELNTINQDSATYSNGGNYILDNQGNNYSNYLLLTAYIAPGNISKIEPAYAEFALNGNYTKFKASLGIPEDRKNAQGERIVSIYLDNKKVYSHTLRAGDLLEQIDINLVGAKKIRFELISDNVSKRAMPIAFFNGEFIK